METVNVASKSWLDSSVHAVNVLNQTDVKYESKSELSMPSVDLSGKPDDYMGAVGHGYSPYSWSLGEARQASKEHLELWSPGYTWTETSPREWRALLSWEGRTVHSNVARFANFISCQAEARIEISDETEEWTVGSAIWEPYDLDDGTWEIWIGFPSGSLTGFSFGLPSGTFDEALFLCHQTLSAIADGGGLFPDFVPAKTDGPGTGGTHVA